MFIKSTPPRAHQFHGRTIPSGVMYGRDDVSYFFATTLRRRDKRNALLVYRWWPDGSFPARRAWEESHTAAECIRYAERNSLPFVWDDDCSGERAPLAYVRNERDFSLIF